MKKTLLCVATGLLCTLFATKGSAQVPTSSFSASQYTACIGDVIQITDLSSDMPTSWSYTLGSPSNTTSLPNPTVLVTDDNDLVISLEATNANGTGAVYSETIIVHPQPTLAITGPASVCAGSSATLNVSGATSYTWSDGSNISSYFANGLTSNAVITATGASAFGCLGTPASFSLAVNALPVVTANISAPAICGGATVSVNGSGADTYTWTGGVTNAVAFTPTANASYNLAGTNTLTGCTSTNNAVASVTVNSLPIISATDYTICSGSSATISPSGASTYTFLNGSSVVSPTTTTSYSIIGSSSVGCLSSNTVVSKVNVSSLPTLSITGPASVCAGSSATLNVSGASTYTWSDGSNSSTNVTNTLSSNAVLTATGSSAAGCLSNPKSFTVSVNALPVVTANISAPVICSGSTVTVNGSGADTYTWTGGVTNASAFTPTANASYNLAGTNTLTGCTSINSAIVSITVNPRPIVAATDYTICSGNSATITPSGAATYTYLNGSSVVSPTATTSYSIIGTSSLGCVSSNTAVSNINVNITPTVSANSGSICAGSSFTITPTGASSYTIQGGATVVNPASTANYTVTGSSAAGCLSANTATSTITVNAVPTLTVSASNTTVCLGSSSTLSVTGASTYTWSTTQTSNTIAVTPTAAAVYSVNGTSAQGCTSITRTTSISVNLLPTIGVSNGSICPGTTFTMTPSGATTYTYSNGSSTLTGASVTVAPVSATNYTVSGTDANGCTSTGTNNAVSAIMILAAPQLTITAASPSICSGSTTSLTASGASTYTWSSSASTATQIAVSPTSTTVYTVVGTGTNVCNGVKSFTLTVNPTPVITINSGTICSGNNYTLNPSGAGTGGTYTLSSASGTITNVISPSATANFSVTGTNSLGCVSNITSPAVSTVVVISSPTISASSGSVCSGLTFSILPTGASTYSVNSVSTTTDAAVTPVATTVYSITGTATNNCVSNSPAVVTVSVISLPNVTATSASAAICIGQATAVLTAGGANTYTWTTSATTSTIAVSPTVTSTYSVTGTDVNGCVNGQTVSVVVNPLPIVGASATSTFICKNVTTTLSASGANNFLWSNGSTLSAVPVTPAATTVYSVVGTSTDGCVSGATVAVVVNSLVLNTSSSNSVVCSGVSATLTASGAVSYTWNSSFSFPSFVVTPSVTTVYTVAAVDASGCPQNGTVAVAVNQLPNVTAVPSSTGICSGESATITASGATSYTWNDGSNTTTIVVSPTISVNYNYTVSGTDANGCIGTNTTNLAVNPCLGTKELSANTLGVKVYPNPNNGEFTIEANNNSSAFVTVSDITGRVVESTNLNNQTVSFDLKHLASGIYYVKVVEGQNSQVIKVVKQ